MAFRLRFTVFCYVRFTVFSDVTLEAVIEDDVYVFTGIISVSLSTDIVVSEHSEMDVGRPQNNTRIYNTFLSQRIWNI